MTVRLAISAIALVLPAVSLVPVSPAPTSPTPLLAAARKAIGNQEQLSSLKTLSIKGRHQPTNAETVVSVIMPDSFFQVTPPFLRRGILGGSAIVINSPGVETPVSPNVAAVYRQEFARLMLICLLRTDTVAPLTLDTSRAVDPKNPSIRFTGDGMDLVLSLNPSTLVPQRLSWSTAVHRLGKPDTAETAAYDLVAEDRRDVAGVQFPYRLRTLRGRAQEDDFQIAQVQIGAPLTREGIVR